MSALSQLLLFLARYWPVVLAVAVLSALGAGLLLARRLQKGHDAVAAPPAATEEAELEVEVLPPADLPSPRQIRRTVMRGFAALRERVTSRRLRYRTPCFLLLGPAGAGKTTLLKQLLPDAVAPADATEAFGCRWHFFDRAVTIEVDGRLLEASGQPAQSAAGWLALHRALRFHRPERPVDGIVLAIPASDLFGPRRLSEDALVARARGMFDRLQTAQRILGVRVPLYLTITKCDLLQGFQDLCTALPPEKRGETFGWANPYALESAFVAEWVDEAFDSLSADLFEVQMELLARGEATEPEGLFQLSGSFRALREPLRTFITELCRVSAYQESSFFRGVYFTGDGTPDAAERLLDASYLEQDAGPTVTGEAPALPPLPATLAVSREPYFLADLFSRKVFGETGLARTVAGARLSRNRSIRAMQAAMIAILLVGGIGIWRASVVLERESGLLLSVLGDIESDLAFVEERSASPGAQQDGAALNNRVFPLLSSMARVNENRLASVFLPSSWASSLHWNISESMRQGFTNVILPAMYGAILSKADSLVSPPAPPPTGDVMSIDGGELPRFLSAVGRLGRNLQRYDTVTFIGAENTELQNLAVLVQYLFDEQLPPEFLGNDRYHRVALWESYGQRITSRDRPRYNLDVAGRAEWILRDYYDALIYRLEDVNLRIQSAEAVQRLTAADLADFRTLREELAQLQRVLDGSEPFWFDETQPIGASLLAVLDSIPNTPITDSKAIREAFTGMFYQVRREKLQELNYRLDPFQQGTSGIATGAGETMALSPQLETLRVALDTLFSQPFLAAGPAGPRRLSPPPGASVRWDVAGLDRALREHTQFEAFLAERQEQDPAGMARLMRGLATVQLEARLLEAVHQAMLAEAPSFAFGLRDRERELRARITAFQEPARRLVQLIGIADRLGLSDAYTEITDIYLVQSLGLLSEVDDLLEEGGTYRPLNGTLAAWDGTQPPIYAAFRARDAEELERYLATQRTRVGFLATSFAAPLLGGLTAGPVEAYLSSTVEAASGLVAKWRDLVDELDRYEAKAGASSVEALEQFVREEMTAPDLASCVANSGRSAGAGGDFFLAARNRLRTQLYTRCEQLAVARARDGYARLQRLFNAGLAGRYPFARADALADATEAEVSALRQFFAQYDALGPFRAAIPGDDATAFLARMEHVRAFVEPLLAADAAPGDPAFGVDVAFRANRAEEVGGDQIVDWTLALGGAPLRYRGRLEPQPATWRPGEPAILVLEWALHSPQRPVAGQSGAVVTGRQAAFRYGGRWALLRLLEEHVAAAPRGERGYLLSFDVPTARVVGDAVTPTATGAARVFVELRLSYPAGGSPPPLPVFPVRAPDAR